MATLTIERLRIPVPMLGPGPPKLMLPYVTQSANALQEGDVVKYASGRLVITTINTVDNAGTNVALGIIDVNQPLAIVSDDLYPTILVLPNFLYEANQAKASSLTADLGVKVTGAESSTFF